MAIGESNASVEALYPLKFSAGIVPVISDPAPPEGVPVQGLPHAAFTVQAANKDANNIGETVARVDPPIGDYVAIILYGMTPTDPTPRLIERKAPTDPNAPTLFHVAQTWFVEGVNIFHYVIERASGNSDPSTQAWALYNRYLPGGNDVPGIGDHPELLLQLPPELGDPPRIGKDEAARGVPLTVSYPYAQPHDQILLKLNGTDFTITLQPGEQHAPLVITLTEDMLKLAGNHPRFEIRYTVISQINNPTDQRRLSKALIANVNLEDVLPGDGEISAPAFPVVNEYGAIGLNQLIDGPTGLHNPVRIDLDYAHAAVGNTLELFFVGYDQLNDGGNLVPRAAYNPQPPYELLQADLTRGYYEFHVPARHHFAVCSRGGVEANVVVTNASGSTPSFKKRVNCDVKKPGDTTCPEE
ncbi:hypothetical protein PS718_03439 [Pseudomonas fluorescens]|uniref:Uncharacterized protein n=1 Tax=Pseudomonas fluorescens TaxID=294 RepID=A0A5E7DAZ6_PSEFL|nr:hypothetical protein [Pseudomonas fluorescens]VVO11088.1 hypothetical protein PS718_03439 [Pseudomonas fluorescens]